LIKALEYENINLIILEELIKESGELKKILGSINQKLR